MILPTPRRIGKSRDEHQLDPRTMNRSVLAHGPEANPTNGLSGVSP
jgi:hypothetical protein